MARLSMIPLIPLALLAGAAAPAPPGPGADAAYFAAVRVIDARMGTIAYRLATANAALCRDLAPTPGWVLHAIDQYDPAARAQARASLGFDGPVAVEAIVPGSPADAAGIRPDETLVSVNGRDLPSEAPASRAGATTRDAALALVGDQPPGAPMTVEVRRGTDRRRVTVAGSPGCRSAFEVLLGPRMTASADGQMVQVGSRFFERYTDDEVAAVVAHELAHNILRHRIRLDAAKVRRGLLAEVGRSARLFQQTEDEADRLSIHLLRHAGYDPRAAPGFWRLHGGDVDGGFFRSRTHPSRGKRIAAMEAEIATIPAGAPSPYVPPVLAMRDVPLQ